MGANIDKAQIGRILVKEGDAVKKGDILMEMVTDKATFDVEADADGTILKLFCKEKDEVDVLEVIGYIGMPGEPVPERKKAVKPEAESATHEASTASRVKAVPGARKIAKEKGIDIDAEFAGTTRVIREEDINQLDKTELRETSFRKKAEIEHLSKSRENIYSSVTIQISATKAEKRGEQTAEKENIRLSLSQFIPHIAAQLLREFPELNAYYTEKGIRIYKNINIGIAMSPGQDLLVPVIKEADGLSASKFSERYTELAMKAVRNTIQPDDLAEGTFTITDLSAHGAFTFMPVINSSQSAILAISDKHDSCSLQEGKLVYDPKINLTLAFDHRVCDGKYALSFLNKLKMLLE